MVVRCGIEALFVPNAVDQANTSEFNAWKLSPLGISYSEYEHYEVPL